jgi:predicted alpha-1,2-mannosidase
MSGPTALHPDEVSTLVGSDSHHGFSCGNTLPLVTRPWAMCAWTPQTSTESGSQPRWIYSDRDRRLAGYRLTHQPSPWIADYGSLVVSPIDASQTHLARGASLGAIATCMDKRTELARPHLHAVQLPGLGGGARAAVAPTERGGVVAFDFPAACRGRGGVVFSFGEDLGPDGAELRLATPEDGVEATVAGPALALTGWTTSNAGGVHDKFKTHFAIWVVPLDDSASDAEWTLGPSGEFGHDPAKHTYVVLAAGKCAPAAHAVEVRVATSFIDARTAWRHLRQQQEDVCTLAINGGPTHQAAAAAAAALAAAAATTSAAAAAATPPTPKTHHSLPVSTRTIDTVSANARTAWAHRMAALRVTAPRTEEAARRRRILATALYRSCIFPRVWHEPVAGAPADCVDPARLEHRSPYTGRVHPGPLVADAGAWDLYRSLYPLLSLLHPARYALMMRGWINAFHEGGWWPKWSSPGYRSCMIGTHMDSIAADAVAKGIHIDNGGSTGFDADAACAATLRDATEEPAGPDVDGRFGRVGLAAYIEHGFVPRSACDCSVARTLNFALSDFSAACLLETLGRREEARTMRTRSLAYRNLFDRDTCLFRPREADGTWSTGFREFEWGGPFVEGGAHQYRFSAPHDPAGLADLYGGPAALAEAVETMVERTAPRFEPGGYGFEIHEMTEMASAPPGFGQLAHSNQPVHHVLWLPAAVGQPAVTQRLVRRVMDEMYSDTARGLPGDEDNGSMSSWFILAALGLYALAPGDARWTVSVPLFAEASIHPDGGEELTPAQVIIRGTDRGDGLCDPHETTMPTVDGVGLDAWSVPHAALVGSVGNGAAKRNPVAVVIQHTTGPAAPQGALGACAPRVTVD